MFVPHARVRLTGMSHPGRRKRRAARRQRAARRKLKLREHLRMPCLLPTCSSCLLGLVILLGGVGMSFVGYHPMFAEQLNSKVNSTLDATANHPPVEFTMHRHPGIKTLSYIGPIFMGCGLFIMIIAGVLYCEIVDKYVNIEPEKTLKLPKDELYDIIIYELRKNYFRGIEVPLPDRYKERQRNSIKRTLFKALSISTPALILTPEITRRWQETTRRQETNAQSKSHEKIKLKKFMLLPTDESWVKTSSLPDITTKNGLVKHPSSSEHLTQSSLEKKRISKSCGNVTDVNTDEANSHLSSSCFDNPAYIPDWEKQKVMALVKEHYNNLVKKKSGSDVCCNVRVEDERGSNSSFRSRHPLATKEELRLFESSEFERKSGLGSTSSLKQLQRHPLQSSSFECEECNGDSDVERGKAKHVSVIVHAASVHQSDDGIEPHNMQSHPAKSAECETEVSERLDCVPCDSGEIGDVLVSTDASHKSTKDNPEDDTFPLALKLLKHIDMTRVTHL